MSPIEVEWDPEHRHRRKPPSRMHALWDQFRGRVIGSERLIKKGQHESRRVKAYQKAVREAEQRNQSNRRKTERFRFNLPFFQRRHYRTRYYPDGSVEMEPRRRSRPFMHLDHRCRPYFHGVSHRIVGFVRGDAARRSRGETMNDQATRERRRRRRKRTKELQAFGHAMRAKHRY